MKHLKIFLLILLSIASLTYAEDTEPMEGESLQGEGGAEQQGNPPADTGHQNLQEVQRQGKHDKTPSIAHSYSIIKFSYDDKSPLGPKHWKNASIVKDAILGAEVLNQNRCDEEWLTPINIVTSSAVAPDESTIVQDAASTNFKVQRSVSLILLDSEISKLDWELGHPADAYHGLEVRVPQFSVLALNDQFDYIGDGVDVGWTGVNEFTNYVFNYASFFYCDPNKASSERSMHQIDGKKFPLEIDFIFYSQPPKIGIDTFICDDEADPMCKTVAVMLVVLAEFSGQDNPKLSPLISAASKYEGPDFLFDDEDEHYTIPIQNPWSPTWLIPESSPYYYYDEGSFPVPPCWPIARIYIVAEHITISHRQLSVLTSIKTVREPTTDFKMPCTFSVLQKRTGDDALEVKYNETPYKMQGDDGRPLTDKERKGREERDEEDSSDKNKAYRISSGKIVTLFTILWVVSRFINACRW